MKASSHLAVAKILATLLDSKFKFLGVHFGLDPIINIIPGVGDIIGVLLSFYIILVAHRLKVPQEKISQMWRHVIIDFLIGFIPVIGVIGDIFYKSNLKNLKLIEDNLPG